MIPAVMPNGAQALIRTLVDAGVTTCFTNPGTSEMHFVAALDSVPEMRAVLGLFEGVATGAADGYARMADRPAATLLHLGPGLGNGLANLHNARRAKVPLVNIVGDHATDHVQYDAPLQSDIESVARNVSGWVRTSKSTADLPRDAVEAVIAAKGPPGQVATLILPADVSWTEGAEPVLPSVATVPPQPDSTAAVESVARALRDGGRTAILLGGRALRERGLLAAARIAAATGGKLLAETFPTRMQRGAGLPDVERIAYVPELASVQLSGLKHLVLVDAKAPVSFFAYPGKRELSRARRLRGPRPRTTRGRRGRGARGARGCARRGRCEPGAAGGEPARPAQRVAHGREGRRGGRRDPARRRDRLRRGGDVGNDAPGEHGRSSQARLADAHRRGHRPRAPGRRRRGGRMPRPPGARARGRRLEHVHDPVAVDDGARAARRHRCDLQQPLLRDPQRRACPGGRPARRPQGRRPARSLRARPRLRCRSATASASPLSASTRARISSTRCNARSPSPAPT